MPSWPQIGPTRECSKEDGPYIASIIPTRLKLRLGLQFELGPKLWIDSLRLNYII